MLRQISQQAQNKQPRSEHKHMNKSESVSFSQFTQDQIRRLKAAFQLLDDNGDGIISDDDLSKIFKGLGREKNLEEIKTMLSETCEGDITFPAYLSLMSKSLGELPESDEIREALAVFSKDSEMLCNTDDLVKCLQTVGLKDIDKLERVLTYFSSTQVSGERVFKGAKFLNTISE